MNDLPSRLARSLLVGAATLVLLASCANQVGRVPTTGPAQVDTLRLDYSNAHLVRVGGRAFLVDAGGKATARELVAGLATLGVAPADLSAVILTHGHADHAGGAAVLQRDHGVRVVAGAADVPMLGRGANDRLCPTGFMARRLLEDAQAERYDPMRADVAVAAPMPLSEALGIEGLGGRLVPVPGHTPGSLALEMGAIAFVGDIVRGSIVGRSAARHFFMCDLSGNDTDIRALLEDIAPRAKTFFAGHFGPIDREDLKAFAGGF